MPEVHPHRPASGDPTPGGEPADLATKGHRRSPWMKILPEVAIIGLCVPLWLATGDWRSTAGGPGPAFYPRILIALLALAMVIRMFQDIKAIRTGQDSVDDEAALEEGVELDSSLLDMRRVMVVIGLSVAYVAATLFLGWVIATFLVVVAFLFLSGKRNLLVIIPLGLVLSVGFAYVFVKIVYISLPTGVGVFDEASVLLFELLGAY